MNENMIVICLTQLERLAFNAPESVIGTCIYLTARLKAALTP
jgi:hypothetical protein